MPWGIVLGFLTDWWIAALCAAAFGTVAAVSLTVMVMASDPPGPTGPAGGRRPTVLFVCVHNAGRSQMAAALLDRYAGGRIDVRSAGSQPADRLNPAVVDAMSEVGIDLTGQRPKELRQDALEAADVVVTMGCGDTCPVFPGKRYLDWALDDPAGLAVTQVRVIRDEIDRRVRRLADELTAAGQ